MADPANAAAATEIASVVITIDDLIEGKIRKMRNSCVSLKRLTQAESRWSTTRYLLANRAVLVLSQENYNETNEAMSDAAKLLEVASKQPDKPKSLELMQVNRSKITSPDWSIDRTRFEQYQ